MEFKIKLLSENAKLPILASNQSAGYDLFSTIDVILKPEKMIAIPLDFQMELPLGYFGKIESRSGLCKKGIVTKAGIIDNDYRGNVHVLLKNESNDEFKINIGDRIAQMIILPYYHFKLVQQYDLGETKRGFNGFGSTGLK